MYPQKIDGQSTAIRDAGLGYYVLRAESALPQSTTTNIFTISGGRVLVTRLIGTVSGTAIQNSDPVMSVSTAPTAGSAVVLASTVSTSSLEIGGHVLVEGDGTALVKSNAGAVLATAITVGCVVSAGSITWITSASKTGKMIWELTYLPLDSGAAVVAA